MPRKSNADRAAEANNADDPNLDAEITETGAIVNDDDTSASAPDLAADLDALGTTGTGGTFFLDLSKADEEIKLIAAGTRAVIVCTASEAKISATGNPMIVLRVKAERIVNVPRTVSDDEAVTYRNRTIRDNLIFKAPSDGNRGTLWRVKAAFEAFDIEWSARAFRTQGEFMDWLNDRAAAFIGAVAEAEIGIEKGNGVNQATGEKYNDRNVIARYHKYTAPAVNDADDYSDDDADLIDDTGDDDDADPIAGF